MPIISIISQPTSGQLKAAYRPIPLMVRANRTDGAAAPPIVFCDVYINGTFYKTQERTQYDALNPTNSDWKFDIMDATQEVLQAVIKQNGGTSILVDNSAIITVYCKFRSSGFDSNGFITPEGTAPIQATGTVPPTAGTGTQSLTFFVVMSTLQHDQNQDLASHLGYYKSKTWDATVFPLTHRKDGYKVCAGDSDYFPIINAGSKVPLCIKVYYKNKGDSSFSSESKCGSGSCTAVSFPAFSFADALAGTAYSKTVPLGGTAPFTLSSFSTATSWMTAVISGSNIVFSGTPGIDDVGEDKAVNAIVTNACGSDSAYKSITVTSTCVVPTITDTFPDALVGSAYSNGVRIFGTGPFTISAVNVSEVPWMTLAIVDNMLTATGSPATGDIGTGLAFSCTVTNSCGSFNFSGTINVTPSGVRFNGSPNIYLDDATHRSENDYLIGGIAHATVTINVTAFTNTNGGSFTINGTPITLGSTFTVVLDGAGGGLYNLIIVGNSYPSTMMSATFEIASVTSGPIGSPSTYSMSKTF